ncbi:MAG: M23 family metallopeptidase [Lactobacillales bacterium]|jgi:murein DD-endopeptidase MepM/ murein hydrolase activator NlpD|nr:M23 family metallopeptidase [Lactobacillales bacterium]
MPKKLLHQALRQSKIARYKAYKKVGVIRHRKHLDISLMFLFLILLVVVSFFFIQPTPEIKVITPPEVTDYKDAQEEVHPDLGDAPVIEEKTVDLAELERQVVAGTMKMRPITLEKGDTILSLLKGTKLSGAEQMEVVDSLSLLINLKTLQPGTSLFIFETLDDEFVGLSISMKESQIIAVVRETDGTYTPVSKEGRVETQTTRKTGKIERTFAGSAKKAEIPDSVISQVTSALEGEIDFSNDVKAGDAFDIIWEQKTTPTGLEIGAKKLLYIGLTTKSKEIHRYAYINKSGTPKFYSPAGKTGDMVIYKRPLLAKARLSSPYGQRRHPVLLYEVFHHGVDLAAPKNTPIIAGADGVITQLGRKGAYGKYIRIKHEGGFQTAYGHMNGYKLNLAPGSKVKRGEVIGYVGATGRATGPHVHYEVWKNGKTVNPLGTHIIPGFQLSGFELEQFQFAAESLHPEFDTHLAGKPIPVPPRKPSQVDPKMAKFEIAATLEEVAEKQDDEKEETIVTENDVIEIDAGNEEIDIDLDPNAPVELDPDEEAAAEKAMALEI